MKSVEIENIASEKPVIHNRGRGPEIKGSRITVYDILDYALECWTADRIGTLFKLRTDQIEAAITYIRDHKIEVLKEYLVILERCERGNPPELQAKLDAGHERFMAMVSEVRQVEAKAKTEIHDLIQKHRAGAVKETAHAEAHGG